MRLRGLRLSRKVIAGIVLISAIFVGFAGVRLLRQPGHAAHQQKAVYYCPMHPTYTSDRAGDCPICNMRLVKRQNDSPEPAEDQEKKILYWTDPMMPGYKSDKPGKSPMGMEMIPVYEEEAGAPSAAAPMGYANVRLSPQKQQFIGVKSSAAQKRSLTKTIRTVGRIAYDPELYQTQQEYLQALRALETARAGANGGIIGQAERLVESSRIRLRLLGLAPDLIDEVAAREGPDQSLLLADPGNRVWLYAPIYEFELPFVKIGQSITAEVQAIPGKILRGEVRSIDPVLDPVTRTARVRAVLTDPENFLRPEMYVNASIAVAVGDLLAVPQEAIFDTGSRQILFVDRGEGSFEPREVVVGVRADGYAEIKSGVNEGEAVVTSGNFLIDSESRLKSALEGMGGEGKGHPHGQ